MSPSKPLVANLYNPHEQSKEQLIESFVVRDKVFKKLFQEIKGSKMKYPEQHYLIEGQRGTGKTTLLLRLSYEIENDEALNSWLIPVVFKEEVYWRISDLARLWETTAQILEDKDEAFGGLYEQMERAYDENKDYERICFEMLVDTLEKHAKKLVLFIDNLGEMFQNFDDKESHRLREILMTCPHLRVIGATSVVLEAFFRYDHAFYEFFKRVSLEELNREETHRLLLELAKANNEEEAIQDIIENQPGRVETLRILTGGVVRTIVVLFEILTDDRSGNAIADLENVLDRVTPLYKHRMDDLAPKQRAIVDAVALNWDAISPEETARKTRRKIDEITAIISELEGVFIIQRARTDTRLNLYYLRERFFNIWYLMRNAPKRSQTKVIWLVRFLENWYNPDELGRRAKQHMRAMAKGGYHPRAAYYLTEALAETGQLDMETEHEMKMEARKLLLQKDKSLAADLSPSDKDLFEEGDKYYRNHEYETALNLLLQLNKKNGAICFQMGYSFKALEDYQKAEKYYLMAVKKGHTNAMNHLGILYKNAFQDYQKAEKYYKVAVEKGRTDAMYNLGILYETALQDYPNAEKYYKMAVEKGNTDAMNNLAWLYFEQKQQKQEALKYAKQAVQADKKLNHTCVLACVYAWNNQIENALQTAKEFMENEEFYETFAERDIISYPMLLLAKERYADVAAYFEMPAVNLKERFKPLYYAVLYFLDDKEYHKLPPELSEPVNEIIEEVKQMAVDYA